MPRLFGLSSPVRLARTAAAGLIGTFSAATAAVLIASAPVQAAELDKAAVETIVREYLLQNPEVIRDALVELDRRDKEAEQNARLKAVSDSSDVLFNSTRQVVLGNPEGKVTLVEFFDYNCGYCKRAHGDMTKLIQENPDLRVVLKEFPVLGQGSVEAAQVAVAVNAVAPEKYEAFHEALLMQRGQANRETALKAATDLGIAETDITKAGNAELAAETIEEVYSLANRLGLTGTPSYVIGTDVVMGAVGYDELSTKLEAMGVCGQTSC